MTGRRFATTAALVDTGASMQLAHLSTALAIALTLGCSSKPEPPPVPSSAEPAAAAPVALPPATPSPARPPAEAPVAASGPPSDFPPECADYANLVDKVKACAKLGDARDALTAGYASLRETWLALPAARRAPLTEQCKVQAESLRNATAATCSL